MVAVLLIAGDHVPAIPFVDVIGKAGIDAPLQNGPTLLNTGVTVGCIVRLRVAVFGQPVLLFVTYVYVPDCE